MDYNRVIKDLNGHAEADFLHQLEHSFSIEKKIKLTGPKHCIISAFTLVNNGTNLFQSREHIQQEPFGNTGYYYSSK